MNVRALPVAALLAAAVAVAGCSGSTAPTDRHTDAAAPPASSSSPAATPGTHTGAPGAKTTTQPPVQSTKHGQHGSTAPATAPYPTPGNNPGGHHDQTGVLNSLPGSSAPSCATVGSRTDVRAGSIAAGNFVVARKKFKSELGRTEVPSVFLYVIPQHAKGTHTLRVTVQPRAGGAAHTVRSTSLEQADQWHYFALDLPVPAPGTYRLRMNAGQNSGCFDVTFTQ